MTAPGMSSALRVSSLDPVVWARALGVTTTQEVAYFARSHANRAGLLAAEAQVVSRVLGTVPDPQVSALVDQARTRLIEAAEFFTTVATTAATATTGEGEGL
ncbi:MAG: hypothetical protein ACFCVF_15740 [Kineosporiaceae bacterium]